MGTNPDRQNDRSGAQENQAGTGDPQGTAGGQQAEGGQQAGDRQPDTGEPRSSGLVDWVTETFLRTAVAILGVLLLLFAVGQIAGYDTIGALGDLLSNEVVQWILVAVFALLLILVASKNWNFTTSN